MSELTHDQIEFLSELWSRGIHISRTSSLDGSYYVVFQMTDPRPVLLDLEESRDLGRILNPPIGRSNDPITRPQCLCNQNDPDPLQYSIGKENGGEDLIVSKTRLFALMDGLDEAIDKTISNEVMAEYPNADIGGVKEYLLAAMYSRKMGFLTIDDIKTIPPEMNDRMIQLEAAITATETVVKLDE